MHNIFVRPVSYSIEYLEIEKCRPFIDNEQEKLMLQVVNKSVPYDDWTFFDESYHATGVDNTLLRPIFANFKRRFQSHLENSTLNNITGFDSFARTDICLGCAQYIDNLHIKHDVQILEYEYNYHNRLNPTLVPKTLDTLEANKHLIISLPFCALGKTHPEMQLILDKCLEINSPVHIDGAWITAARNINIDLSHPAIKSFSVSMSKGYGLSAWNRIGLRWTKDIQEDSITVLNDFAQINTYSVVIGNYFLQQLETDHLWKIHGDKYFKICNDFGLTPSDTIHMATKDGKILGVAPLLRYLENV